MAPKKFDWEPAYGFCASSRTNKVVLAQALEKVRRQICAYGSVGDMPCDCKYGAKPGGTDWSSEETGCPELREVIYRLLNEE